MNSKKGENPVNNSPIETERKYLIRYPDTAVLAALPGARILHMHQTYLLADDSVTARVRQVEENGTLRYIRTEKRRISAISSYEDEREMTAEEYKAALETADPERQTVVKTRYAIPHGSLICEIDVYPFWEDRAILEIELPAEDAEVPLPDYIAVIREVSGDRRYSNRSLAKSVPMDEI